MKKLTNEEFINRANIIHDGFYDYSKSVYYNTCIEFNGKQHYESVPYWGGEEGLKLRLKLDKIKKDFCSKHKINLLIIKYNDDIEDKLNLLRNKYT